MTVLSFCSGHHVDVTEEEIFAAFKKYAPKSARINKIAAARAKKASAKQTA